MTTLCASCYTAHLSILCSLKKVEPKFDDESLKHDIDSWLDKARDGTSDTITQAVLRTASSIGNILKLCFSQKPAKHNFTNKGMQV